jgi:GT2 family glycosyltransferase
VNGLSFAPEIVLAPVSRSPTTLADETLAVIERTPLPQGSRVHEPAVSAVVVTFDGLPFTRLCLESLLAGATGLALEVVVVDNASRDDTRDYLERLAAGDPRIRLVLNDRNTGFAAALNRGVAEARAPRIVLMNNDVVVPPGALARLARHLERLATHWGRSAATRRPRQRSTSTTAHSAVWLLRLVSARGTHRGQVVDVPMLTMFCVAMRRDVYELVGPVDQLYGLGLFEDDDYSLRVDRAGLRIACAEDVLVHHFGEAAFGSLRSGEYSRLFRANRIRFERKWGVTWRQHQRRLSDEYRQLVEAVRVTVRSTLPGDAQVLVVSRGDAAMLDLDGRRGSHFPQVEGGSSQALPGGQRRGDRAPRSLCALGAPASCSSADLALVARRLRRAPPAPRAALRTHRRRELRHLRSRGSRA